MAKDPNPQELHDLVDRLYATGSLRALNAARAIIVDLIAGAVYEREWRECARILHNEARKDRRH
jgi:hypothetical protein